MRKVLFALLVAAASLAPAGSAHAQSSDAAETGTKSEPRIDVTADRDRQVCRAQVRTNTRMRSNQVCRTQQEWDEVAMRKNLTQEEELTAAADTLRTLGNAATTGDIGGFTSGHETSLDPR